MYKLLVERDERMFHYAKDLLESGESKTTLFAVGMGHMVGSTEIVQLLQNSGYTVQRVPVDEWTNS